MMTTVASNSNDSDLLMKLKRRNNMKNIDISSVSSSYSLANKQLITNLILFFGLACAIYCVTIACNTLNDQEELIHHTEALFNQNQK